MKTEFEMTPEMGPRLDKLEAELRKVLAVADRPGAFFGVL